HRTILTEGELKDLLPGLEAAPLVGFDTLYIGEEPTSARLIGLAFAFGDEAAYLPLDHRYQGSPDQVPMDVALEILRPWLEHAGRRKVGENVKPDSHVLANAGVTLAGGVHDTILESYVLEVHEKHDLGSMAQR